MYIVAELHCENTVFFDDTCYIEACFELNGIPMEDTAGCDRFLFNGAMLRGRRIGATGRACRHTMNELTSGLGTGAFTAPGGRAASATLEVSDDLKLRVRTNIVLDPGLFARVFSLRLELGDSWFDIPLCRPDVEIEWVGRGEYLIPLNRFLVEAFKRRRLQAEERVVN